MADPIHSPDHTSAPPGADQGPPSRRSRWAVVVAIAIAVVLLGLIILLHLSGAIGPGVH